MTTNVNFIANQLPLAEKKEETTVVKCDKTEGLDFERPIY